VRTLDGEHSTVTPKGDGEDINSMSKCVGPGIAIFCFLFGDRVLLHIIANLRVGCGAFKVK
jgi:hypothetical protein